MNQHTAEAGGTMAAKAAPPVAVVGAKLAGFAIADWVQYATFVYLLLMITHKAWQMWRMWKTGKDAGE